MHKSYISITLLLFDFLFKRFHNVIIHRTIHEVSNDMDFFVRHHPIIESDRANRNVFINDSNSLTAHNKCTEWNHI